MMDLEACKGTTKYKRLELHILGCSISYTFSDFTIESGISSHFFHFHHSQVLVDDQGSRYNDQEPG